MDKIEIYQGDEKIGELCGGIIQKMPIRENEHSDDEVQDTDYSGKGTEYRQNTSYDEVKKN